MTSEDRDRLARKIAGFMRRNAAQASAESEEQQLRLEQMRTENDRQRERLRLRYPGRFAKRP